MWSHENCGKSKTFDGLGSGDETKKMLASKLPDAIKRPRSMPGSVGLLLGNLRYEDGKAGTAVDVGNFRGSRHVAKNKILKMCIFANDGEIKISNFENAILGSNDIL